MVNKKFKPVQSLQRGLAILEHLSERSEGASLKELAACVQTSPAAAFHLVHTLVEKGYVQRLEEPVRYVLGERCVTLATRRAGEQVIAIIYEEMLRLAEQLAGVAVHFSEYVGGSVVLTAHASSQWPGRIEHGNRHVLPPYASGGSLAHLAFWPQEVAESYENRFPFEQYGLPFWRTRTAYQKAFAAMRAERFFLLPENSPLKVKLAMPVLLPSGALRGAITLQWNQPSEAKVPAARRKIVAAAHAAAANLNTRLP